MRITESYTPISLLAEIVTRRGVTAAETKDYFSHNRSSHDWLVQEWSDRLEMVLCSFERYGIDVKPVQFIRDHGVDVLLRSAQGGVERLLFRYEHVCEIAANCRVRACSGEACKGDQSCRSQGGDGFSQDVGG